MLANLPTGHLTDANTNTPDATAAIDPHAFYNVLWNDADRGLAVLDVLNAGASFRLQDCNGAYAQQQAVKVEQLRGQALDEAFTVEVAERYQKYYEKCVQTGQLIEFEEERQGGDRTTYWQVKAHPLRTHSGEIIQLLVTVTDVTAQHDNVTLTASNRLFQQVTDKVPAVLAWKDKNSTYLGGNRPLLEISGFNQISEIVGKTEYDMPWKKEEADFFMACDQRVMCSDQAELNIIEPQQQSNGRQAWLNTSKFPLHDDAGSVIGILVIVKDITEHKETQDLQARLLAILSATPDIVSIHQPNSHFRYLNLAGQQKLGCAHEALESLNLQQFLSSEGSDVSIDQAFSIAAQGGLWSGESLIQLPNGQDIPVSHVIICHQAESGAVQYFSSIMRDIGDRKAAETKLKQQSEKLSDTLAQLQNTQSQIIQTEKMSSLGQMVAGVAHEINNPVNFIHGNLNPAYTYTKGLLDLIELYRQSYTPTPEIESVLEEMELDFVREDLPKLLNSMVIGTNRIREIVLSLRNFARLDESAVKTVDIHEGIDSTLVILNHRLKTDNSDQSIELSRHYGELPLVACYPSQLNQVLMNILSNAIDALADHPAPRITITTESQNGFANIRIEDNGPGIPQAIQSQILNPFFTTKPVGKGTGMGMSISYQIITEKHGGQLTFSSAEGQGTEFSISIPIHQS